MKSATMHTHTRSALSTIGMLRVINAWSVAPGGLAQDNTGANLAALMPAWEHAFGTQ